MIHSNKNLRIAIALIGAALAPLVASQQTNPECQRSCGNLTIPYPFGIGEEPGCYWDDGLRSFTVSCDYTEGRPAMFMLNRTYNLEIIDISVETHEMRTLMWVASDCYSASGNRTINNTWISLPSFRISSTKNTFTAVGCDTVALFQGQKSDIFATGCVSFCENITDVINGSCSGIGCCQNNNIPNNARSFIFGIGSLYNHSYVHNFNPCSYAFMVESNYFNFSSQYLYNMEEKRMPLILNWAIGNQTCDQAKVNMTSYLCTENTNCTNADGGSGYRCHCLEGYQGNPYLPNGCQDIDECETIKPCNKTCTNLPGTYNCSCPVGYKGDGRKDGTGCSPIVRGKNLTSRDITLGVGIGLLSLILCGSWAFWGIRHRKTIEERKKFFRLNGGMMLQQLLSEHETSVETVKVYSDEELKKATNNYSDNEILGQGGQGTVYRGVMPDNKVVAIKKARMLDRSQVREFINEIVVLSQINHKNIVKLIGCCLETEHPLLVYEFITNGTLHDHIHNDDYTSTLSWSRRLCIAAETAGALSYLHHDAAIQIIHRDIKSTNILLDENYTAKISDFGASRLVPMDQTQINTVVQGTLGYLDPEYLRTSQLTEKSDVYSFGVVLAELMTGRKAISFDRSEKERNLSSCFATAMEKDGVFDIVDKAILDETMTKEIKEVAVIANRCLRINGEDRPTMKEVAMELEGLIRATGKHPWTKEDASSEERENLLGEVTKKYHGSTSVSSSVYNSIWEQEPFQLEEGR